MHLSPFPSTHTCFLPPLSPSHLSFPSRKVLPTPCNTISLCLIHMLRTFTLSTCLDFFFSLPLSYMTFLHISSCTYSLPPPSFATHPQNLSSFISHYTFCFLSLPVSFPSPPSLPLINTTFLHHSYTCFSPPAFGAQHQNNPLRTLPH